MITHEPEGYLCPFCDWLAGNETEYKQNSDIVYQDENVTAFIAPKWWVNNPGHVIVIPNYHYENVYSITDEALTHVYKAAKKTATALREVYEGCTGTSTRQHNEPDGNQDVWHFHVHVYPRYKNDKLYQHHDDKRFVGPQEREPYAKMLKEYFRVQK
jgi:histidine triad (HIT) family protein